ncbi:HAD-IB family hydrolase [Phycicoccus sonneratiae]|uniref:HAD-IB family hydrolase n=1 Tax=Phycicoccus sonneratiae TaxID=2807628 RepID=A0ABS2CPB6_9MICO|nr:HAD-IB family hydrolase [Phycicoccus sonneraticus]MBM6401719.1 HAD-IB family hydrolase [Phycicoccus sonneraticus]
MSGAAIFDLDRTLLQGGTGPLLSRAMYDLGVVSRKLPGEGLLYKAFDVIGETLPSIALARQATLVAKGRAGDTFDAAARSAAETIAGVIHPFALTLIEQHRAAGRPVVLATTTPEHLVRPLAERLGVDHVVATRYAITEEGTFSGALEGRFVWSRGKLAAVREWAEREGVDLAESFAYSDSIYDLPLLSAVGSPAAVNPDPRLTVYALARGWPIVHFDVSPGVVKVPVLGVELQRLFFLANPPAVTPYARFDVAGTENIPRTGPAILVGNHRSYFDIPAMIQMMRRTGRTGRILAKKELFDVPVVGALASALGGIPVDRAGGGQESFEHAAVALAGGELVCLLPQGTIPRGAKFYDPVLKGRTGAARLAAATGAPVIPFGVWGSEKVWPRSSTLPRMLSLTDPPTVRVRVGPPVEVLGRSAAADTRRIMEAIVDCLPPEAREERTPTEEEIRLATPGGRSARS